MLAGAESLMHGGSNGSWPLDFESKGMSISSLEIGVEFVVIFETVVYACLGKMCIH